MATKTTAVSVLAIGLTLVLGACGESKTEPTVQSAQQKFCTVIDSHREQYSTIRGKPAYLDQERDYDAVYAQRGQSLKQISGDGTVSQWRGKVRTIRATNEGAAFGFDLPCNVSFVSLGTVEVKRDDPVFQQLRALAEGGPVTFSGRLLPYNNKFGREVGGFTEGSITQDGSMGRPEFLLKLSQVSP
jgi:hypothetical protein